MKRNAKLVSGDMGRSLQLTAWAVADSLRTSTTVSPKYRPLKLKFKPEVGDELKFYEVQKVKNGVPMPFTVRARNKREAKKKRGVLIGRRGLAARGWGWAQGKLGRQGSRANRGPAADKMARRLVMVTKNTRGDKLFVQIRNRVNYAMEAFKSSGEQTLNNVMARAARKIERITEQRLAKRMGAK
jgi:hypothetical protein